MEQGGWGEEGVGSERGGGRGGGPGKRPCKKDKMKYAVLKS